MRRPGIKRTGINRKGTCGCHHGHKVGDTFDFDTRWGAFCPMAMHVALLYMDILRCGGRLPGRPEGAADFCCPDADVVNVFRAEIVEAQRRSAAPFQGAALLFCSPSAPCRCRAHAGRNLTGGCAARCAPMIFSIQIMWYQRPNLYPQL